MASEMFESVIDDDLAREFMLRMMLMNHLHAQSDSNQSESDDDHDDAVAGNLRRLQACAAVQWPAGRRRQRVPGSTRGRLSAVRAKKFDKDRRIADHENSRVHCARDLDQNPRGLRWLPTSEDESPVVTVSPTLSNLKAITLKELILGKRHHGRVLLGQFCVQPYMSSDSSINTVLEGANGTAVRVIVYNCVSSAATTREVELRFPSGMRVAIKEPLFKYCVDEDTAVIVGNPEEICVDNTSECNSSPAEGSHADNNTVTLEELETIRNEGNRLFGEKNWIGAVTWYSQCIYQAVHFRKSEKKGMKYKANELQDQLNCILMLAYSNRAEAWLRLQDSEKALCDADKALELDAKHIKTLVRKGKAEHGLGLFKQACQVFQAALEQYPKDQSILKSLKLSRIAYEQFRTGEFDLSDYFLAGDVPPCTDFTGPVEIRRVSYGCGKRGLFATKDVEAGKVLLVSNPLAIAGKDSDVNSKLSEKKKNKRGDRSKGTTVTTVHQQDLIKKLTKRVMTSKRQMAQLYSLAVKGQQEMEIPSMKLFKPGSDWVPHDAEKLQVDVDLITEIVKLNSFGDNYDSLIHLEKGMEHTYHAGKGGCGGIWVLPSFANHSCVPNCFVSFIGHTMFVRTARDVKDGEELTIPYFDDSSLCEPMDARQAFLAKNWCFTCRCERCLLEESLKPQFSKISKVFPRLGEKDLYKDLVHKLQAMAEVADEVEEMLYSGTVEARKKGWIRAPFRKAYWAKRKLATEEHVALSAILALKSIVASFTSLDAHPLTLDFQSWSEFSKTYSRI